MIRVVVLTDSQNQFASIEISGHGIAENGYGHDIYCAGVSSCSIGALNALENAENYDIQIASGYIKVVRIAKNTLHDEIVLETLITQLGTISKSYPDYVEISLQKEGLK